MGKDLHHCMTERLPRITQTPLVPLSTEFPISCLSTMLLCSTIAVFSPFCYCSLELSSIFNLFLHVCFLISQQTGLFLWGWQVCFWASQVILCNSFPFHLNPSLVYLCVSVWPPFILSPSGPSLLLPFSFSLHHSRNSKALTISHFVLPGKAY